MEEKNKLKQNKTDETGEYPLQRSYSIMQCKIWVLSPKLNLMKGSGKQGFVDLLSFNQEKNMPS